MKTLPVLSILTLALCSCVSSPQTKAQNSAQALFNSYQTLEHSYDPALADLYCGTAVIRNIRTYPDGQKRTLELPATKYKELIRTVMPLAKSKGDYSTYSGIAYSAEGSNTRITATRYSVLKKYSSPISLLVGPCAGHDQAILEELGESQP